MKGYVRDWERLQHVLKRVIAIGDPEDEAQRDICRAIADRKIRMRLYFLLSATSLERCSRQGLSPNEVRYVQPDEIPPRLKPSDLDWAQSRIRDPRPWGKVQSPSGSLLGFSLCIERTHHGSSYSLPQSLITLSDRPVVAYWYRVELFRPDVTKVLITKRERRRTRTRPTSELAKRGLKATYGAAIPDQVDVPNPILCRQVIEKLREIVNVKGMKLPSDDTILRAAGRRK